MTETEGPEVGPTETTPVAKGVGVESMAKARVARQRQGSRLALGGTEGS